MILLNETYYKNIPSRNILNDVSNSERNNKLTNLSNDSLENMIINSNLANSSIIK